MANWYSTREALKRMAAFAGTLLDSVIDEEIEAASREVDRLCHRRFIPLLATRQYRWPQRPGGPSGAVLYVDDDLLTVTALTRDDDTATPIAASDYYLEPQTLGPPYDRIELDLGSTAVFSNNLTPQRAVRVTGLWGYGQETASAGALAADLSDSATTLDCTDGSRLGVGDTLLCGSEQLFVSGRDLLTTTATITGNLPASKSDQTLPLSDGTKVRTGELIQIDNERMLVFAIAGNTASLLRAEDSTTLAAHTSGATVYALRRLTVQRGVNGTTAAAHTSATPLSRYVPPADVARYVRAVAINAITHGKAGWSGTVGAGEAQIELRQNVIKDLRTELVRHYRRHSVGAVGGVR